MSTKIAIIDAFQPQIMDVIAASLPAGWTLQVAEDTSFEARRAAVADADVVYVMATPMPRELLDAAPRLRFIQKLGAGVDRIDIDHCRTRGITVARLFAGNAIPVAEHTVLMMMATYRNLVAFDAAVRAGKWDKEGARAVTRHLHGKTVGIVGFGAIGRAVAVVLSGFGVNIVYYDPMRAPPDVEAELRASMRTLDQLLAESDVVSLHLPLMAETANLIDAGRLALMKRDAILVNCARGGLVDEAALAAALAEGRIAGAAVDAFAKEPPLGSPLLAAPRTVLSPHLAGATLDNFASIMRRAVDNTHAFKAGQALPKADVVTAGLATA